MVILQMDFHKKTTKGGVLPALSRPLKRVDPYAHSKLMTFRLATRKEKILKKMMYVSLDFSR